jgi:antitoxin CptB
MNGESVEARRRRLAYRCARRGMLETDLILGGFAARTIASLDAAELDRLEELSERRDDEILAWVTGREPPPPALVPLLARIRAGVARIADN